VTLRAAGQTQRRQVMPTRSYLSQVELPLTFGLGETATPEGVTVHWPDGTRQELADLAVDRLLVIEEPPASQAVAADH
jgi:hypothetical protein